MRCRITATRKSSIAQLRNIDRYLVAQYARLVAKLRSIREGEGTLLDNCMVLYGSGLGDGNSHTHDHLPIVLAGRGGGTIQPGRHLQLPDGTPLNNLLPLDARARRRARPSASATARAAQRARRLTRARRLARSCRVRGLEAAHSALRAGSSGQPSALPIASLSTVRR